MGPSCAILVGEFTKGCLVVEHEVVAQQGSVVTFDGRDEHWSQHFWGERFSIILFYHTLAEEVIGGGAGPLLKKMGFKIRELGCAESEPQFKKQKLDGGPALREVPKITPRRKPKVAATLAAAKRCRHVGKDQLLVIPWRCVLPGNWLIIDCFSGIGGLCTRSRA